MSHTQKVAVMGAGAQVSLDLSFRVADVLLLAAYLGAGIYFFADVKAQFRMIIFRITNIERDQDRVEATIDNLRIDLAAGKVQDTQIKHLEQDASTMRQEIADLRRGKGFIEREINGQYSRTGKVSDG